MKKLFLMGAFALLGSTIISCTADEIESENKTSGTTLVREKTNLNDDTKPTYADGPGDEPVVIQPPKNP